MIGESSENKLELDDFLRQVVRGDMRSDSAEFAPSWQSVMAEYTKVYPMYCYIDRLTQRREKSKRKLQDIHQSWLWRLLTPLRWLDDALRQRRRKKHLVKRAVTTHA